MPLDISFYLSCCLLDIILNYPLLLLFMEHYQTRGCRISKTICHLAAYHLWRQNCLNMKSWNWSFFLCLITTIGSLNDDDDNNNNNKLILYLMSNVFFICYYMVKLATRFQPGSCTEYTVMWWGNEQIINISMEQSPSLEANRSSASQEVPRILRSPNVHYRIHRSPLHLPLRSQMKPV
jgi:hypothetical protein